MLDYLASGIDPEMCVIYLQSAVPETHELHTYLQNLVTVNRLLRLPSIKQMAQDANIAEESLPFGLLGYPVLQAADILLARAHLVPVGRDNAAHVEITRELARQFNHSYGPCFLNRNRCLATSRRWLARITAVRCQNRWETQFF